MYTVIIILIVLASIFMCGIVLLQESKGGGLASSFSSYNQIMGVRKTTDIVEKITWGLAATMVILAVISTAFVPKASSNESAVDNIEMPAQQGIPAATQAPAEQPAE